MIWDTIYGRQNLKRSLQEAVRSERTAHAYLFYGPEGIGKKTIAAAFASSLNCLDPAAAGCGSCISCRKAQNGTHPDLHLLEPDGKSFKIDQIRKLKRLTYLKPREGRYQVFILQGADMMTSEAANSLLKILEEPPAGSVFLLLSQNPFVLPATIRSRCQMFSVGRLDQESMAEFLQAYGSISDTDVKEITVWTEGVPGRAVQLMNKESRQAYYMNAVSCLSDLLKKDGISQLSGRLAEQEDLTVLLDTMMLVLRDLLVLEATKKNNQIMVSGDHKQLKPLTGRWTPAACRDALRVILKVQDTLQKPVNARLAVENALRDLKEVVTHADGCRNSF